MHTDNSFVTLTFNDEALLERSSFDVPPDQYIPYGSLSVRDLQLFIKKLRFHAGYPGIRYYACGEYGDRFQRPHYHICLFNYRPDDLRLHKEREGIKLYTSKTLDKIWGHGYTLTGDVTFQSAAYVSRYIMKKINGANATSHYENVDPRTGEIFQLKPEFTTMSRRPGIGKTWYDKFKNDVFPHDEVVINGKSTRPPAYYSRLFEAEFPSDFEKLKSSRLKGAIKHLDNNTPERLKIRSAVQQRKLKMLPRTLEGTHK